jgi:cytochrome c oxidase assembly protein subunit 15
MNRFAYRDQSRSVAIWLFVCAAMVFAMVVIGGVTRLTGSGLSITEWKPIMGAIPPMTDAAWADAFQKYKTIPQYAQINAGMSLSASSRASSGGSGCTGWSGDWSGSSSSCPSSSS